MFHDNPTTTNIVDSIVKDILSYIFENDFQLSEWYVGIASNPREKLFQEHNVMEDSDLWIIRAAESITSAKSIAYHIISRYGTDGLLKSNSETSKFVYAFKKGLSTEL